MLNAAAYTAVDAAETAEGRRRRLGRQRHRPGHPGPARARAPLHAGALLHRVRLRRHRRSTPHTEDEPLSPLGVYAQTKAAGDVAVGLAPRHYVLRTSWVIGEGKNFVRTMQALAANGVSPCVVDDQVGRLTFTDELVRATRHLLDVRRAVRHLQRQQRRRRRCRGARSRRRSSSAPAAAPTTSPARAPRRTPRGAGAGQAVRAAPAQLRDVDLAKIRATGFEPEDALVALGPLPRLTARRPRCEAGELTAVRPAPDRPASGQAARRPPGRTSAR